jgi:acyl-CoA reductase-like NAD-dependent aldehyde dehydrogenase
VLQVLPGSGSAMGDALVTHSLVRKISFTGSTEIGRRIMELASRDIKRVSLELGGKSPNIVFADADWQRAAETSPMSVFANTGQDCCARSRMFIERAIYEPFVEKFVDTTKSWRLAIHKNRDATRPTRLRGPANERGRLPRRRPQAGEQVCLRWGAAAPEGFLSRANGPARREQERSVLA